MNSAFDLRHHHVVLAERNAGLERLAEAERHDAVAEDDRLLLTAVAVDDVDHAGDFLLRHQLVDDVEGNLDVLGQKLAEEQPPRRRVEDLRHALARFVIGPGAALDLRMQRDRLGRKRMLDLAHVAVEAADRPLRLGVLRVLPRLAVAHQRHVVEAQNDVLARHDDRLAVGGVQDVVGRHHEHARFQLRFERQRHVHGHLVAVEVGVEGRADERMQLDRLAFDQHRLERLNAEAMQGRRAVQHHRMFADHLVEDVPDFRLFLLDQLLGLLDGSRQTLRVEARIDERLEQLERHLLRQAALMELELGTDDDDRAARIVDALAEQVLAEPALLALQHVGERLQRTLVGAGDDAAAPAVVEQRVDRLLQHALFVADDDVGRAQLHQPLQAVVAVDDAAVEIVEVRGREAAAVERHQRPQVRRDDRHLGQDHPFGLVAGVDEGLDDLQALGEALGLQFALRLGDLDLEVVGDLLQVHALQNLADRLGADHGGEAVLAVFVERAQIVVLAEELTVLQRRQARIEHDVGFEIEDALEVLQRHVEQKPDARGQRLQEPDVGDGRRERDMAHALAPHARQRHFDAALLADDALVLHPLILAAQALVVLDRPEDAGAEQAVPLRLERAVVDRLGLLDLAERPRENLLGRGDRNLDLIERLRRGDRGERIGDFLVHSRLPRHSAQPTPNSLSWKKAAA